MAEMTRIASVSLGSEFNAFLFAPIGEERNGSTLSVVSALARSDVDPWQEAAKLARLPRATAAERLAAMIGALPDATSFDTDTIATHLIALLPGRAGSDTRSRETLFGTGAVTNSRAIVLYILIAFVLLAQGILASRQPQAQVEGGHVPAPTTIVPKVAPPRSGQ